MEFKAPCSICDRSITNTLQFYKPLKAMFVFNVLASKIVSLYIAAIIVPNEPPRILRRNEFFHLSQYHTNYDLNNPLASTRHQFNELSDLSSRAIPNIIASIFIVKIIMTFRNYMFTAVMLILLISTYIFPAVRPLFVVKGKQD